MTTGTHNGKSRLVAVRLPHDLDEALAAKAKQDGTSVAKAIIAAAWKGLGVFTLGKEKPDA